ncbi:hypothetical protein PENSPDRAFT_49960 [Peniophora sp. CONT]|nr:hypothetical protein PENSPDRAFT_49960 [Peniophora sp. CONT]
MAAFYDKPPRYDFDDRLVVDTLYDLRARAHKHAKLIAAHAPVSPVSPLLSDGSSTHTFNIDLESIWADDDEEAEDELASSSAGPSTPRSPVLPPPRRVSSVSSFFIDGEEGEEPAPAYEYEDSQDSSSTWGPASTARLSTSTVGYDYTKQAPVMEDDDDDDEEDEDEEDDNEVLWDADEDPWTAFAAVCWAACVDETPQPPRAPRRAPEPIQVPSRPRASSLATISTGPRPSPMVIAAPLPGNDDPASPFEGRKLSIDSAMTASSYATTRSDGAGGLVYKSSFARTEPELGVWRAPAPGDTAIVRPLGAEESRFMGFGDSSDTLELQVDDVRESENGSQRHLTRLEYRRPRQPSPPRVDAQFNRAAMAAAAKGSMWSPDTPTPSMADIGAWPPARGGSGKGLRNFWRRATGKENSAAHLGSGRPVYAGF